MNVLPSGAVQYVTHVFMFSSLAMLLYALRRNFQASVRLMAFKDGGEDALRQKRDETLAGLGLGAAVFCGTLFVGLSLAVAIGFGVMTLLVTPRVLKRRRAEAYRRDFDRSLADALETVRSSLKAGLTLKDSLNIAAEGAPPVFAAEVGMALKEYRFGVPIEEALNKIRQRVETASANIAFGAMIISSRLGGRLPETLSEISRTIRERERVEGKLKALTAQGRAQSAILIAAPPLMAFGLYLYDPAKMALLTDTFVGQILLTIAIVLEVTGIFVTRRIMRLEI